MCYLYAAHNIRDCIKKKKKSSQEAASDTWPGREPPAGGDFLALVRWRAGLRWAPNEGAVNLAVPEFPEVSGSSAGKRWANCFLHGRRAAQRGERAGAA